MMTNETTQPTSGLDAYHVEIEKSLVQRIDELDMKYSMLIDELHAANMAYSELEQERDELKVHCNKLAMELESLMYRGVWLFDEIRKVVDLSPKQSLAEHDAEVINDFNLHLISEFTAEIRHRLKCGVTCFETRVESSQYIPVYKLISDLQEIITFEANNYANNLRQQKDK